MEKQKRKFKILLVALVVLSMAYAGIYFFQKKQEEKAEAEKNASEITVMQMEIENVSAFSYQLNGETLSFEKNGEVWQYQGDASLDLDEDAVEKMLLTATSLTAEEKLENGSDLSEYGLDVPQNSITIRSNEGEKTLYIGDTNAMTGNDYVMLEGDETIYIVDTSLRSAFEKDLETLTEKETDTTEMTEKE